MEICMDPLCAACFLYNEDESRCWKNEIEECQERERLLRCRLILVGGAASACGCYVSHINPDKETLRISGSQDAKKEFRRKLLKME